MFNFKPITRPLNMAEYAPEYAGAEFQVWVNMPRAVLAELRDMQEAAAIVNGEDRIDLNRRVFAWCSKVFSQSDDQSTHLTPDEVEQLVTHLIDTDPQAWPWLISRVQEIIADYRTAARKN